MSSAAAGMTSADIQAALAMSYVRHRGISSEIVEDLVTRKTEVVRSSEVLEFVRTQETLDNVGGLGQIKEYLATRSIAFGPAAERYGLVTNSLIEKLHNFSGAEMEAVLDDALYTAFYDKQRALTRKDIEIATSKTVPLAEQMRDEIEQLRQWGRANARPASG